ncbi:MAG TPA: TAXI family TRAP transporter solute-binding subunit [Chloroflexota bacterium]
MPEPLPIGANFKRAKVLWEVVLDIAGDPATPYYGPRDICVTVGSGSGDTYKPYISMSTGSPILAHAAARREIGFVFVNPSAMLTQAYRGTGLFREPLPLRAVFSYPSWDRFVVAMHPRTGLKSLAEVKDKRLPLRLSIREDATHSTRVCTDQLLSFYGFTLEDLQSWGGTLQTNGGPGDKRRLNAIREGTVECVIDEGITTWLKVALEHGFEPITLEDGVFEQMTALGWRRVKLPKTWDSHLAADHDCIDYSGWPVYTSVDTPEEDVYKVCQALAARADEISWEDTYEDVAQLGLDREATPLDVPLHPGAAKWYREQGISV